MRFPNVAICTLTVLVAGALTAHASDSIPSGDSAREIALPNASVAAPSVAPKGMEAIAELNRRDSQQIVQPEASNINPESSVKVDTPAQTTQAATPVKVEAVAQRPEAEALKSDQASNKNPSLITEREKGAVVSKAEALRSNEIAPQSATVNTNKRVAESQPEAGSNCIAMANTGSDRLAQGTRRTCPRPQAVPKLVAPEIPEEYGASPALSIYIPVGYGADKNTVFLTGTYENSVRNDPGSVGTGGIGVGLGDAKKAVGAELSYTFTTRDDPFGEGGFNAKLHRQLGQDASAAIGWNGFLNIGRNDFEQSKYGVITKVFRTQDSLNKPFSRVAFTVGVGDGQFRSNGAIKAGDNNVNVFGNVAVRVARPVSFITEWTGTDLALGLSIAPFRNIPFVITPAVRDVVGAGDSPRFVLGAGTAFRF